MNPLWLILFTLGLIIAWMLALPLTLRLDTGHSKLSAKWFFIRYDYIWDKATSGSFLVLFGFRIFHQGKKNTRSRSGQKKKKRVHKTKQEPKKTTEQNKAQSKQAQTEPKSSLNSVAKPSWKRLLILVRDPEIRPVVQRLVRFLIRLVTSVRLGRLKLDLGWEDCFIQGVAIGLASQFGSHRNIEVRAEKQEQSALDLSLKITPFAVILALSLLAARFPYLKAARLYKNFRTP